MNPIFNESTLRRFNRFALPAAVVWSLSSLGSAFLSQSTAEGFVHEFDSFFEVFHFGEKFVLSEEIGAVEGKTVTTTTLVPYPHRIKAIYRAKSGSFITINDGKESSIVPLRGTYKKEFRLIGLSDSAAVFKGYGKTYRLRLGFNDPLAQQETVTRTVADPSKPGQLQNEWRTIPRKLVMNQIKDLQKIHKRIHIKEVMKGNKISGFRVNSIDPDSVFARLGLQAGDVIVSVNNAKLESYADAFRAYGQVPHMRSIQITVLRNNLPKDIVYEITR